MRAQPRLRPAPRPAPRPRPRCVARADAAFFRRAKDAKQVVEMVAAEGAHCIALAGDAALLDFAEDAVQKTLNAFGRIDILVNNAGVQVWLRRSQRAVRLLVFDIAVTVRSTCTTASRTSRTSSWWTPSPSTCTAPSSCRRHACRTCAAAAPSSTPAAWRPTRAAMTCASSRTGCAVACLLALTCAPPQAGLRCRQGRADQLHLLAGAVPRGA